MTDNWITKLSHFLSREPHSQSELIEVLRDAEQRDLIDHDALQMIEGVLAVSDKKVRDIMIPRPQMVVIDGDALPLEVLQTIITSRHSRFPVIENHRDKIIGILLAKDLLPFTIHSETNEKRIRDLIRPAVFIPEGKPLDILLKEFRSSKNHMAVVVDEYGGIAGLVTIEDVLEQIVGEIDDEYDVEDDPQIKEIDTNTYSVNALTSINDFNEYFNTNFNDSNFDTIGGLIVQQFGFLPKKNDHIKLGDFEVTITKSTRRHIQWMQFKKV